MFSERAIALPFASRSIPCPAYLATECAKYCPARLLRNISIVMAELTSNWLLPKVRTIDKRRCQVNDTHNDCFSFHPRAGPRLVFFDTIPLSSSTFNLMKYLLSGRVSSVSNSPRTWMSVIGCDRVSCGRQNTSVLASSPKKLADIMAQYERNAS